MSSYYLIKKIIDGQRYKNIKAYRYQNQEEGTHALISNQNTIELYKVMEDGLAFQERFHFTANIAKIEVIPSLHHSSDYLWILDQLGRFTFWSPQSGFSFTINQMLSNNYSSQLLEQYMNEENAQIMSGVTYIFEEKDTCGLIFYTISKKLEVIEFQINKLGLIMIERWMEKVVFEKTLRFMDWVRNSNGQLQIGVIVEQQDGSTFLQIYEFKRGESIQSQKIVWHFEKKNLLHFYSHESGDILITTYDQIALHSYKESHPIKCYRTKGNYGQGFYLGEDRYGHVGKELVVFGKDKLNTYADFKFEDESIFETGGFTQCSCLRQFESGAVVIGLLTHLSELYLIKIFHQSFSIFKHSQGILQISSIKAFEQHKNLFAVVGSLSEERHQIALIQSFQSSRILRDQRMPFVADVMKGTIGGSYLIIGCRQCNFVMRMNKNHIYEFYFYLPHKEIKDASGHFLILSNGVYELDYQIQDYEKVIDDQIVLGRVIDEDVIYLNEMGVINIWNSQSNQTKRIVQSCFDDYCWGITLSSSTLMCANALTSNYLRLICQQSVTQLSIKGHTLISCLSSISLKGKRQLPWLKNKLNQHILIGYADGSIHLHSQNGHLLGTYSFMVSNFVYLERMKDQTLVLCGDRQFILNYTQKGVELKQIQLNLRPKIIQLAVYLQKLDEIIFLQSSQGAQIARQCQIPKTKISPKQTHVSLLQQTNTFPLILTQQEQIIIATVSQIKSINIKSKRVKHQSSHNLKQISAISQIELGILLAGINVHDKQTILLFNGQLQTIASFYPTVKKPIKYIKTIQGTNEFYLLSDDNVSLHKIQQTLQMKLILGSQLNLQGQTMEISSENQFIMINDPNRYLSIYQNNSGIIHIGNLLPVFEFTASAFIQQNSVVSDMRGVLSLFSVEKSQPLAISSWFLKQGIINLGESMLTFQSINEILIGATNQCSIYSIEPIQKEQYDRLHRLEEQNIKNQEQSNKFSYWHWRGKMKLDHIIDGTYLLANISDKKSIFTIETIEEKFPNIMNLLRN